MRMGMIEDEEGVVEDANVHNELPTPGICIVYKCGERGGGVHDLVEDFVQNKNVY